MIKDFWVLKAPLFAVLIRLVLLELFGYHQTLKLHAKFQDSSFITLKVCDVQTDNKVSP